MASEVAAGPRDARKPTTIDLVGGIYCHICTLTFANKKAFDQHYLSHSAGSKVTTYTCVACRASSTSYPTFRGHCYTAHVLKGRHKCDSCNKNFSKFSALKEHIDGVHNIRCNKPNCGKRFLSKKELHVHQVLHKEEAKPPYQCQTCTQEIENMNSCEDHIDKHCVFTYPCPVCNENLTKENASQHLSKHFGNIDLLIEDDFEFEMEDMPEDSSINIVGGISCCHCQNLFKTRYEIDQHFAEQHPGQVTLYSCIICGKQYEKYSLFGNHCYFHYSRNKYVCEICHRPFSRLSRLVSHAEEHKAQAQPAAGGGGACRCRLCGLRLGGAAAARRHLPAHRRAQFACPVCARRYAEKYLLMKHIPQHFEAVLHVCRVCHKVFGAKNRLMEHAKTHAENARAHRCPHCSKAFHKPYQLSQHVNVHTGARPYACPRCPKSFASHPNWHKHLRRMHGHNSQDNIDAPENDAESIKSESCKLEPLFEGGEGKVQAARAWEPRGAELPDASLADLTTILPEDIDQFVTEMLHSESAGVFPREYGPDFGPEASLPHAAPQLVAPARPAPAPAPAPAWRPPLDDLAFAFMDTDVF